MCACMCPSKEKSSKIIEASSKLKSSKWLFSSVLLMLRLFPSSVLTGGSLQSAGDESVSEGTRRFGFCFFLSYWYPSCKFWHWQFLGLTRMCQLLVFRQLLELTVLNKCFVDWKVQELEPFGYSTSSNMFSHTQASTIISSLLPGLQ